MSSPNRRHFASCPAAGDPTARCFCPPEFEPRSLSTVAVDEGFSLTPPERTPDNGQPRKGETRGQAETRLRRKRRASMIAKHGPGPAGFKCGTCIFLELHGGGRHNYNKCRKYGVSSSWSSDWSFKWDACGLYQSK